MRKKPEVEESKDAGVRLMVHAVVEIGVGHSIGKGEAVGEEEDL